MNKAQLKEMIREIMREENEVEELDEMTGTSAIGAYSTPFCFSKNKDGSKKAIEASEATGYKVVKSISENN